MCLTAPLIEAMDPMHDHLSESLSASASGIDDARREVEAAQPPLLRLAASEHPAHQEALRRSGKALKKQCQLAAKDAFTKHRLAAEASVARSPPPARRRLDRTTRSLAHSREIAAETSQAADTHEVDLRRRLAASADVAGRQAARMRTRVGKLSALAERRARLADARALAAANADAERLQRRGGEMDAERERATAALEEARLAAAEEGVDAADGGASARAAAAARVRAAADAARAAGDELAVLNRVAPWRLEKVTGVGGGELTLRVGRLFRVVVDVGTGAGRVTLAESSGVTPERGMRVCRRRRGRAARVERNVAGGVRGGRHRRAATRRAGAETRGKDARGGGGVPIRVPARREGEMHRRGGPRTLVRRFRRGAENRRRAHRRGGGVPEGRTHAARDDRAPR